MMAHIKALCTDEPALCGVCRRRAWALGYTPNARSPILWLCDDPACLGTGRSIYHMPKQQLDAIEIKARNAGGDAAGQYLESVGHADTPLGDLPVEVWFAFLTHMLHGYEDEMRRLAAEQAAPF